MVPPIFLRGSHDATIQKNFKLETSLSNEYIFGRFPYKTNKIVTENECPEEEHLSTTWNCIVEPHGDTLPLLLYPSHPENMVEHLAIPSIDFPGYWSLSGKSGLFFESLSCVSKTMIRKSYFYGLTDNEVAVLRHRTNLNKKFAHREIIFQYMMDQGYYIAPNENTDPPLAEEIVSINVDDEDDDHDEKPSAKKMKPSLFHPGKSWVDQYISDNEDLDHDNTLNV